LVEAFETAFVIVVGIWGGDVTVRTE